VLWQKGVNAELHNAETCYFPRKGNNTVSVWLLQLRNIERGYDLEGWRLGVTEKIYGLVAM